MSVKLIKASVEDARELYSMQIEAFKKIYQKYQDHDTSPVTENLEKTVKRLKEDFTDYYFIVLNRKNIGAARVRRIGEKLRLGPFYILPEFQGFGYAQTAIIELEKLYTKAKIWELDTIKQEEKLCYLYEKMGYKKTGEIENINKNMDIIEYKKEIIKENLPWEFTKN